MIKFRKYVAIIIFIASIVILTPNFFHLNNYKKTISQNLYHLTGYHLLIEGDIKLFFVPNIRLKIDNVKLYEELNQETPVIYANKIEISPKILSLLKKKIEIDNIYIDKPVINLTNKLAVKKVKYILKDQVALEKKNKFFYRFKTLKINDAILNYQIDQDHILILNNMNIDANSDSRFKIDFVNNDLFVKADIKYNSIYKLINDANYNDKVYLDLEIYKSIKNSSSNIKALEAHLDSKIAYEKDKPLSISGNLDLKDSDFDILLKHNFINHTLKKNQILRKISYEQRNVSNNSYKLNVNLDLHLTAKDSIFKSNLIKEAIADINLENDNLTTDIKKAQIAQGTATGLVNIDNFSSQQAKLRMKLDLYNVEINNFLQKYKLFEHTFGKADVTINLNSVYRDIIASSSGDIRVKIYSGEINQISPEFRNIFMMVASKDIDKIIFKDISGNFKVSNGILSNDDLLINSDIAEIKGSGIINLNNETLDYNIIPITIFGHSNKDHISLNIKNNLSKPKYSLNLKQIMVDKLLKKIDPGSAKVKELIDNNLDKVLKFIK